MDPSGGATSGNWTEAVEDLIYDGEIDQAICILESTVSKLEKHLLNKEKSSPISHTISQQLSTALQDLSKLYSAKGLSLKADQSLSRAIQIKHQKGVLSTANKPIKNDIVEGRALQNEISTFDEIAVDGFGEKSSNFNNDGIPLEEDDDWEAIADHTPQELLPQQSLPAQVSKLHLNDSKQSLPAHVSKLHLDDSKDKGGTKRRGRGTFSYKKQGMYSDKQSNEQPLIDEPDDNSIRDDENLEAGNLIYGTRHVLVLADFPPNTRTTDLEKLFQKFKEQFVIRWVNDTMALAVFRTPSIASEASSSTQCSFKVRLLEEGGELLSTISPNDLKPPRERPKTSARTAQRLIAQSMGIKLPSSSFGTTELRKQEQARKNRIVSRQNMRDDAWGDDDV